MQQQNHPLPLLLPVLVKWHSIVEDDSLVAHGVINSLEPADLLKAPCPLVAITKAWMQDESHPELEGDALHHQCPVLPAAAQDYEPADVMGIGEVHAYVAPWQILPIDTDTALTLHDAFHTHFNDNDGWIFYECLWCELEYADYNGEAETLFEWHEDHTKLREYTWLMDNPSIEGMPEPKVLCYFETGMATCSCGMPATYVQRRYALLDYSPFVCGHCWFPERYQPIWEYAVERYVTGWDAVYEQIKKGDPWSTSLWQQSSPFLVSASHAVPHLVSCQASQNSAKQLDLFQEFSQPSTLSA